jgi:hypothetical protein
MGKIKEGLQEGGTQMRKHLWAIALKQRNEGNPRSVPSTMPRSGWEASGVGVCHTEAGQLATLLSHN